MEDVSAALMEEDISILATNWIPNSDDASSIRSRNTEVIGETHEKIAAVQVFDHRLTAVACKIGDAMLVPIRYMPVEILAEIFVQCIPSLPTECSETTNSYLHPQDVAELLGNVCQRWRTIVNDTPRIWSTLLLNRDIQAPEDVYELLVKSKSCPLDLFIEPSEWFPDDPQEVDKCINVFGMLRSQSWRIRTLISNMCLWWFQTEVMFPKGSSINLPMMQTLSYTGDFTQHNDDDFPRFYCPELRSVILCHGEPIVRSLVANPVQTVRHLAVSFLPTPTTALYPHLLRTLPNLVSLYWKGHGELGEIPQAVVLKSLKSLRLHATGAAMSLLSCLNVPSLESLEVLCGFGNSVYDAICALCGDGTVKLRRLHIVVGMLPVLTIRSLLRQLNSLETLIIEESYDVEGLLVALAPQDQDFSLVCPHLTTLVIAETDYFLEPLIEFVYRRMQADSKETAPGFVKCLKLTKTEELFTALSRHNFLQSHSTTVHLMLEVDYQRTPMQFSEPGVPERRYGWDV